MTAEQMIQRFGIVSKYLNNQTDEGWEELVATVEELMKDHFEELESEGYSEWAEPTNGLRDGTTCTFDPGLKPPTGGYVSEVTVVEIDDGMYDLFDQNGNCLNLGCPFPFQATKEQIREFVLTGIITDEVITIPPIK
jgi:hypothetical protein